MVQLADDIEYEQRTFLSFEQIHDLNLRSINPSARYQVQFRLNNRVHEFDRRIYSLFDMIGDVGGFLEAIYVINFVLISLYATKVFKAEQIKDIFHIRTDTKKTETSVLHKKLTPRGSRVYDRSRTQFNTFRRDSVVPY